ncbi:hypothetical protein ACFX2I_013491 [Malus domestica]
MAWISPMLALSLYSSFDQEDDPETLGEMTGNRGRSRDSGSLGVVVALGDGCNDGDDADLSNWSFNGVTGLRVSDGNSSRLGERVS